MTKIDDAINYALRIANDDSHGYDQIKRNGPDYDCSSLIIEAWEKGAGVPVASKGGATYTENMREAFKKCGFVEVPLSSRKRGDVLLNEKSHTAMMIDSKNIVHASINEKGTAKGGKTGDQTGQEICTRPYYKYSKGWDVVLRYAEAENDAPTKETTKDLDAIADEVIKGMWGNGAVRKSKLEKAGYKYDEVQKRVNEKLNASKTKTVNVSADGYLNVRATPNGVIIGGLKAGTVVNCIAEAGDWVKIEYLRGAAYVSKNYLK